MKLLISFYITNFNEMKSHWNRNSILKKNGIFGTNKAIGREVNLGGILQIVDWNRKKIIKEKKLSCPSGITKKGENFYIASMRENIIYVLNKDLKILKKIKNKFFNDIHDINMTKKGLLVSNTGLDNILEIDLEGNILWNWFATENSYKKNRLGEVRKVDKSLNHNNKDYPTLTQTTHLNSAIYSNNSILCSLFHQGEVIEISRVNKKIKKILKNLKQPHSLKKISEDKFLISDTNGKRIIIFKRNGSIIKSISVNADWIQSAIQLKNKNYLVADSNNSRIMVVDSNGNIKSLYNYNRNYKIYEVREI